MAVQSLIALALATGSVAAMVEPAGDRDPATRNRVVIGVSQADSTLEPSIVSDVVAVHLVDVGFETEVETLPGQGLIDHIEWAEAQVSPDIAAVYFIETLPEGRRRLYLVEPGGGLWVRELPRADDRELLLESLGAMLRGTSVALRDGTPRGMKEAERPRRRVEPPPDPEPKLVPRPPPPRRAQVTIALAYTGTNLEPDTPWQSGGAFGLDVEFRSAVWAGLGVAGMAPARAEGPPDLVVWRIPVLLEGGYRFRPGKKVRPGLGVGLVLDPMWWRARGTPEDGTRVEAGSTARIALTPIADLRWRIVAGLGLGLRLRADTWLLNADLVVEDGPDRRSRFRPFPVGAVVEGGIHYTF